MWESDEEVLIPWEQALRVCVSTGLRVWDSSSIALGSWRSSIDIKLSMGFSTSAGPSSPEPCTPVSSVALSSEEEWSESMPESFSSIWGRRTMTFLGWMCRKDVLMVTAPISLGRRSHRLWILNLEAMTLDVTSASCHDWSSELTHLCGTGPAPVVAGEVAWGECLTASTPSSSRQATWMPDSVLSELCPSMVYRFARDGPGFVEVPSTVSWGRSVYVSDASLWECISDDVAVPVGSEMAKLCRILLLRLWASRMGMRVPMCSTYRV